jgi:hypothetical protein
MNWSNGRSSRLAKISRIEGGSACGVSVGSGVLVWDGRGVLVAGRRVTVVGRGVAEGITGVTPAASSPSVVGVGVGLTAVAPGPQLDAKISRSVNTTNPDFRVDMISLRIFQ